MTETAQTLARMPETQWEDQGPRTRLGWSESSVCVCWVQCRDWPSKRLLVGLGERTHSLFDRYWLNLSRC